MSDLKGFKTWIERAKLHCYEQSQLNFVDNNVGPNVFKIELPWQYQPQTSHNWSPPYLVEPKQTWFNQTGVILLETNSPPGLHICYLTHVSSLKERAATVSNIFHPCVRLFWADILDICLYKQDVELQGLKFKNGWVKVDKLSNLRWWLYKSKTNNCYVQQEMHVQILSVKEFCTNHSSKRTGQIELQSWHR